MRDNLFIQNTLDIFRRWWITILITLLIFIAIIWGVITGPDVTTAVLASTIRHSTPLVLGALCGLLGERSGVINIGIEGQMLLSAFVGFLFNVWTGNLFIAVMAGVITGAFMGFMLAFMSVTLKIDQIIGGTVINILAIGLTGYFYTAGLITQGKLQPIPLGPLADIPIIGPVLFNNPPITYITIIMVFGRRLRWPSGCVPDSRISWFL
jgi:simple sugar transport system permease protein